MTSVRQTFFRSLIAILVLALIGGGYVNADAPDFSKEPHLAVLLTRNAHLVVDGKPSTLKKTEQAIDILRSRGGVFWYARENGNESPSPDQERLFDAIFNYVTKARLPIRLFTDGTFTKLVPM